MELEKMKTDKIQLIDFFTIIIRRRKLFLVNMASVGLVALLITLFLPKWYESKAIVLPPMTESLSFGLGSLSSLAGAMMGPSGYELPMLATRSDVYKTMLESRRMYKTVIEQNDLYSVYKEKNLDLAIRKLKKNLKIDVGSDASLSISFEAKENPEFAAQVANSFVSTLDRINTQTLQNKARDTRQFIQGRLDEAKVDLANAEEALKKFQEENNTISIEEQTKATIEGAADILAQYMTTKIELGVSQKYMDSSHNSVQALMFKVNEIDKILQEIRDGDSGALSLSDSLNGASDILIPLNKVPSLGLEMARLIRELKIQEFIFEFLMQQYEQAKIKEQESTPSIQVLQYAEPAQYKSRPKRAFIILAAVLFAFFISLTIALLQNYLQEIKTNRPDEYKKINWMFQEIRSDLLKLGGKRKD
jgi:uncharacterized protein involved in exopolysaccharide biosynthesis